ncbi:hypothetical protein Tco_1474560 [Tanacetum coccineum]
MKTVTTGILSTQSRFPRHININYRQKAGFLEPNPKGCRRHLLHRFFARKHCSAAAALLPFSVVIYTFGKQNKQPIHRLASGIRSLRHSCRNVAHLLCGNLKGAIVAVISIYTAVISIKVLVVNYNSRLATSGIMYGSMLSDDSSQHSDPGLLNDCVTNGVVNHEKPQ